MNPIFPYSVLPASPKVSIKSANVDGVTLDESLILPQQNLVTLHDHFDKKWKRLKMDVEVVVQPEVVKQYESKHGTIRVFGSLNCRPTNQRFSCELSRSTNERGKWLGVIEIDRSSFSGRVDLSVSASAQVNGLAGRIVGNSDPWWIFVDEPNSLKVGGAIRVSWVRFRDNTAPALARQFPEATHVVDLEDAVPVLYLNQDFEGLFALLQDRRDRATVESALHDAHRYSIARSVWMALTLDSVMAVEPGETELEASWPSKDWQCEVLKKVLPKLAPDKTDQELLNLAANDWKSGTSPQTSFACLRTSSSSGHMAEPELHTLTEVQTDELNAVTIVEPVDSGLYGKVYKGVQSPFDRPVAVKIIKDCGVQTADVVAHARLLTRVQHPAVVTVFAVQNVFIPEFDDKLPAIIMEWLEGASFGRRLGDVKFTTNEAVRLSNDVLSGIGELHKAGIRHGDLHYGNVIVLNDGHAKIIDIDANKEVSLARLSTHSQEGAIASDIDYCRGIIFKTLKHSEMSLSQLSDIEPQLQVAASLKDLRDTIENLNVDSEVTEKAALSIICEDTTYTAQCSVRIAVEAQKTIDGVGIYVVECEPEIAGIENLPLRPVVGINDTHEVSVNAGNPQKFHLLNRPASHATMHLMTVHAGTMKGTGIQYSNTEQRLTLRAVGRDARSEDVTITIRKNGDEITVACG